MSELIVYGISLSVVGGVLVAIVRHFAPSLDEKWLKVGVAVWSVLSYLLVTNLELLESLIPSLPIWLPQALMVILVFGGSLGLAPGEISKRLWVFIRRR